MKKKLKLFVWNGFCPDYTNGLAVAIAHDETEAKKLIIKNHYDPPEWGNLSIHSLNKKFAVCVSGGG